MSQKTIKNFFKPIPKPPNSSIQKRKSDESVTLQSSKKKKCDTLNNENNNLSNSSIKTPNPKQILAGSFGLSWFEALSSEFSKPYFRKLEEFIAQQRESHIIFPPSEDVFSWTLHCDVEKVKVVILGQDPYHGVNQAHGLAFSVKKGVDKPPSLINIFKEVQNNYLDFIIPNHGDLTGWAKQGVLLLNACLTVQAHLANSHSNKGWEQFTDAVIKYLNDSFRNRVFLLWGNYAQKKGSFIDQRKHLILKTVHPSPLSASRGFFGCNHFKKANDYLIKNKIDPIDWNKLD
ncbi:Uracil-DNA glycosylase [Sarcoptes scabiei]|uniref:Uracil-DNA glycosylase n=2 Tax=Sarcoptes scabiei TaxID=52283 RepID=A0A834R6V6_SARSC|nr:Uracil-DNA glycosylase [Sarcoptes scabiei]